MLVRIIHEKDRDILSVFFVIRLLLYRIMTLRTTYI